MPGVKAKSLVNFYTSFGEAEKHLRLSRNRIQKARPLQSKNQKQKKLQYTKLNRN